MDKTILNQACAHLRSGDVIAYPTEAVWGFGCDPFNAGAVQRTLLMKQRPESKGLILVVADMAQIQPLLADLSPPDLAALTDTWPGPVTWLIPDPHGLFPHWIKGEHSSVAIRVSAHPVVQALCRGFGGPIVSTSANRGGEPEIRTRKELEAAFGTRSSDDRDGSDDSSGLSSKVDFIVPGDLGEQSQPSEIRDLTTRKTLR